MKPNKKAISPSAFNVVNVIFIVNFQRGRQAGLKILFFYCINIIINRHGGRPLFCMPEQILEQLFDSPIKVKLLKLFLRNPNRFFSMSEIVRKIQSSRRATVRQVKGLESIDFLKSKKIKANSKKQIEGSTYYGVNPKFDFYYELQSLILKSSPTSKDKILAKILKLGRIKLALIGGVFLNLEGSRVDLFLVGDDIDNKKLKQFLSEIESEVGKEIEYAAMDAKEFDYRYHMFDRFVRDVIEKPHEKLVNKIRY